VGDAFPSHFHAPVFSRVIDRFAPLSPARYHSSEAHETSLRDVETDDAMAFFHFVRGFLWSYFLAWDDQWGSALSRAYFNLDENRPGKGEAFRYLEGCWGRICGPNAKADHREKQHFHAASQNAAPALSGLQDHLRGARSAGNDSSGMSLLTGAGKILRRVQRRQAGCLAAVSGESVPGFAAVVRVFHEVKKSGAIPEKNLLVITYPRLMNDLEQTMNVWCDFWSWSRRGVPGQAG
jgi:hypothetical protein